jgi:hypothetical protein
MCSDTRHVQDLDHPKLQFALSADLPGLFLLGNSLRWVSLANLGAVGGRLDIGHIGREVERLSRLQRMRIEPVNAFA